MLPARTRMRRSAEFATTVRHGRRGHTPPLTVHVAGGTGVAGVATETVGAPARVGFVVGRAIGSATVRNRVRRRLRHLVRARLATLPPGAAVVVRAHPPAAGASSAELARALDAALTRVLAPRRTSA